MKLSSRKQLLKESDTELNKIRLRILLESDGEVDTEKIEKVAQKIADKKTKKMQSEIERNLENLKRQSISMQREFEKAHRETGISIEEWYKRQQYLDKWKYTIERYYNEELTDDLWSKTVVYFFALLDKTLGGGAGWTQDREGNLYNIHTGSSIEPPTEMSSTGFSILRSIIQSLSL